MPTLYILNGPEIGRSAEVQEGVSFLGRSRHNDIRITDGTVSRKHLKILIRGGKLFITDLESQNRTYYKGKYLVPGEEVEIEENVPIAIGMTVICLGEGCRDKIAPYLDTVTLIKGVESDGEAFKDRRKRTWQKRGDLINRVSLTLKEDLPLTQMLQEVLGHIFHHLKRIDRGAFVLVDAGGLEPRTVISRWNSSGEENLVRYSEEVVRDALKTEKPVVFSKSYVEDRTGVADTLKLLRIESVMCLPLIGGAGAVGAIYLDSLKRPDGFRRDDLLDLLDIAQRIAVAVESERFAADMSEVARSLGSLK